jgi:hypothetical protein
MQRSGIPGQGRRLGILAALCLPGIVATSALALDSITRPIFGSALTDVGVSWWAGGLGWPLLRLGLDLDLARSPYSEHEKRPVFWPRIVVGCLVATYSAVFFIVWFVIIPLGVRKGP